MLSAAITEKITNLFKVNPIDEDKIKVNGMMRICFEEREPLDAIVTFEKFKTEFEKQLKIKSIDAKILSSDCDTYFRNKFLKKQR
jgi:hypothetical protein